MTEEVHSPLGWVRHEERIVALEAFMHSTMIEHARDEERRSHIDERFDLLGRQIDDIRTGIKRLLWIVGGAAGVAAVNFIIRGGLAVGGG